MICDLRFATGSDARPLVDASLVTRHFLTWPAGIPATSCKSRPTRTASGSSTPKGGGFVLNREHHGPSLPARFVAKSWSSLWQPKLNVAWLPPENVFLRVIELPKSNFDETLAMVELQLEKLSPMPVTQIVWTMQACPPASLRRDEPQPAGGEATAGNLQTIIVVIAARNAVEEFLGKLEGRGFLADRLEVPFLDQLEMDGSSRQPAASKLHEGGSEAEADAWIYPLWLGGQNAALVAWWCGGALRNLSFVTLPPAGDRTAELKKQLALLAWAGELEGWLTAPPNWHLVADPVNAAEWENALREVLGEPVRVSQPLPPADLAGRTARRAAAASERANLLPAEFSARYHQQFVDRLWLRGLGAAGVLYAVGVAIYFCAVGVSELSHAQASNRQVADIERQLHQCDPAQGALRGAQGTAGVEIRRAGLLESHRRAIARRHLVATVQLCRRQQTFTQRDLRVRTKLA